MEEPVSGSEDEDEGNVEDDNETPVIEEETTPEEEAVEIPEETPEVTPEEPAEETPDFGASMIDSFDEVVLSNVPVTFKFTVDGETPTETDLAKLNEYITDKTGITEDGKTTADADPTFKIDIPETVELKIGSVTAKIDNAVEGIEITASPDVYTVAGGKDATAGVEITIALVTKTYTVNAPDTANSVSWKIKKAADASYADPGTSVAVTKAAPNVKLQATLAENAAAVDVTIGEVTKSLNATTKTAEFEVAVVAAKLGDTAYEIEPVYQVKAEVTVKGKTESDTFTTEYAVKKDGTFGTWTAVPATGKIAAAVDDVIGLKFTVTGNKTIKAVTGATDADDDGIYELTVVTPAADVNTVEVELEAARFITVKGADADAKIKSVKYTVDSNAEKTALKSGTDWKISVPISGTTNVTVTVTAEDHNRVSYICKAATHAATGCEGDLFAGPAASPASTGAIAISTIEEAGLTLNVKTEKITVPYTLTADGFDAKIYAADGTTEVTKQPDTAADDVKGKYVLDDGAIYYVKVADEKLEDIGSITANGTADADKLKLYPLGFRFVANVDGNSTIAITAKTKEAKTITVVYKNAAGDTANGDDFTATIKADKYNSTATTEVSAATEGTLISAESNSATAYSVWEDTPFTFAIAPKNGNYYKIDAVAVTTDNTNYTPLTEESGKYTIAKAQTCTIAVTVALDTEKAENIKFTYDSADIASVKASLTGDASPETNGIVVKAGETKYFKKASTGKVTFAVTPATGYTVDTVKAGETDLTASAGVYTYTYEGTAKTAEIAITTKATALNEDKYVTFNVDTNSGVTVKVDEKVTPIEKDGKKIYKLTKAVAATDSAAAVAEIPELAFDVIVPYGKYLADKTFVTGAVRATTEKRTLKDDAWVYSYKVVANQVTSTEGNPAEITIAANSAVEEKVTIKTKVARQTVEYKNLDKASQCGTLNSTGVQASIGDSIVVMLDEGQSLKLNDEACKLDELGKFSFEVELQEGAADTESVMELDVTDAEAAEFDLLYAVEPDDPTDDAEYTPAGKAAIQAEIGDKIYVKLQKSTNSTEQAISKTVKSEGATSAVTLEDQTAKAGQAVIDVKDESFSVDFYYEKTVPVSSGSSIEKVVEEKAAGISIEAKDAAKAVISAKGINKNGTTVLKLDATSRTEIPLTIKKNNKAVSAAAYDETFQLPVVSDPTVAAVTVVNGSLIIETLKGDKAQTEVKLLAKGQAADAAPILSFKVEGQTPALKVSKVESPNQGIQELLVNVTADGNIKPVSSQFTLYYEIGVARNETNPAADTAYMGYYYLPVTTVNGKIAPVSQLIKVNNETAKEKTPNKYTVSARMVAVKGDDLTAAQMGDPKTGAKVAQITPAFGGAEVKKEFATKTLYYEDKLGVTKKTTKFYSGQDNVLVAIPKFSKNAGYVTDIRAQVYNKDGSLATRVRANDVDLDTMEVTVDSDSDTAGNYDVVIYATATKVKNDGTDDDYDMYRASAKVPITVQKAINYIDVTPVDEVTIPNYGTNKAKDVSITLKPVGLYDRSPDVKAQTQKFEYWVDPDSILNSKNADKVVVKGSKITVKKDFSVGADPEDNKFTVYVSAADYSANDEYVYFDVYVTKNALELGSIQLKKGDKIYSDKAELTAKELAGAEVIVKDKAGRVVSARLVDYTPNKGNVYVYKTGEDGETAKVYASAFAKTLTIKAVTRDGGKKSATAKFTLKQTGGNFVLTEADNSTNENPKISNSRLLIKTGNTAWTFKGANDDTISFTIKNKITDEAGNSSYDQAYKTYYNYTVKITGGKNTLSKSDEANGTYKIAPTADKVVVAITDKTVKNAKPVEFTINNTGWSPEKAPSASTKDKLYVAYTPGKAPIRQDLTYTVKGNKGYNAVQLTCLSSNATSLYSTKVIDIVNDQFTLTNVYAYRAGTDKFSLVYGKKEGANFVPMTKAANLSIKASALGNIKLTNKYTISTNVSYGVKLDAKPALKFKDYSDAKQDIVKYVRVLSANVKGERNQFVDYFEVTEDGRLQIKTTKRSDAELAKLTKDDYVGYLEYCYALNSTAVVTKQEKITVKIDEKGAPKYAATPINVVAKAGVTATTSITLGGEKVAIGKVAATADSGWTATTAGDNAANGIVTLTAAAAPASKNVDLYIVPADAKDAATADALTKGIKVTVAVKTVPENDTKTKISLSKKAKVPTAAIVGGNSVELTAVFTEGTDFTCLWENAALTNAQKLTDAEADALAKPADQAAAKLVKTVAFADTAKKTITMTFDRDKLPTAKGKTVYSIPVKLTFEAGAVETVNFSVQPEMVPSMTDVEKIVKGALDKYPVSDANNSATAISEVTAAIPSVKIPALSGITAGGVAVKDAEKFADKTVDGTTTPGDHTLTITLTDVTKAADAEGKTKTVDITVTAKVTLDATIKSAVDKWRVPGDDGKVPEDKTAVTPTSPTEYEVQAAIQAAVDSIYAKGKYVVAVSNFDIATIQVPAPLQLLRSMQTGTQPSRK